MFSDDRKEPGTPKFGKLYMPFGLWINSPKKHFVKLGKRWPSAGSVKSTSSETGSRTSETAETRPLRPGQSRAAPSKRVSQIFGRWSREHKPSGEEEDEEEEDEEGGHADDRTGNTNDTELSLLPSAPGVLKIYGERLCAGAHYKSVLVTSHSSAAGLLREVLGRYALAGKEPTSDFVLCEAVGRSDGPAGGWRCRGLRPLAGYERPLLLREMWRPAPGLCRRFEVRRRRDAEEEGGGSAAEAEAGTEGINAQARRLQRSRAHIPRGEGAAGAGGAEGATLRRSISEANLSGQLKRDRKGVKSMLVLDGAGRGETVRTDDKRSNRPQGVTATEGALSLVRPPSDHPYFLLLHGYDNSKDLILHLMMRRSHVFGRPGSSTRGTDTALWAPDIEPRHCSVRRAGAGPGSCVRPSPGALVTVNGQAVRGQHGLRSGDLLGLGRRYLLMYKEPGEEAQGFGPGLGPGFGLLSCRLCGRVLPPEQERQALEAYLSSREPVLIFPPGGEGEGQGDDEELLANMLGGPDRAHGAGQTGGYALTPAYLLAVCLRVFPSEAPLPGALLLKAARGIRKEAWERIKEIGDKQAESPSQEGEQPTPCRLEDVMCDLRPLMYWMSNSIELLNFSQTLVSDVEKEWENAAQEEDLPSDRAVMPDFDVCEEAMVILDEIIMYTFQQCVYYLTKTLHPLLPSLLDSNPFVSETESADVQDVASMPGGVRDVVRVFQETLTLCQEALLHPDLVSQLFGYLFFFSNASVFNTVMERGGTGTFYQWARAVQIRTNLDLVLDWLHSVSLGDVAAEYFRKLSATVNLLCVPKNTLLQMSWPTLQEDNPVLSTAQLTHILNNYHLGQGRQRPAAWTAMPPHAEQQQSADIFASFTDHPPLVLPSANFRLCVTGPVPNEHAYRALRELRTFLWERERQRLPANQRSATRL